jgi:hypothetical protein
MGFNQMKDPDERKTIAIAFETRAPGILFGGGGRNFSGEIPRSTLFAWDDDLGQIVVFWRGSTKPRRRWKLLDGPEIPNKPPTPASLLYFTARVNLCEDTLRGTNRAVALVRGGNRVQLRPGLSPK